MSGSRDVVTPDGHKATVSLVRCDVEQEWIVEAKAKDWWVFGQSIIRQTSINSPKSKKVRIAEMEALDMIDDEIRGRRETP